MQSYITFTIAALAALSAAVPHARRHQHVHARSPAIAPLVARGQSNDGSCGGDLGFTCAPGNCCSSWGYCGNSAAYCGVGCQSGFGDCGTSNTTSPSASTGTVISVALTTATETSALKDAASTDAAATDASIGAAKNHPHPTFTLGSEPWSPSAYTSPAESTWEASSTSAQATTFATSTSTYSSATLPSAATTYSPTSTIAPTPSSYSAPAPSSYSAPSSSSASPAPSSTGGSSSGSDSYKLYTGDGSTAAGWPSQSDWVDYESMWSANMDLISISCTQFGQENNSDDESDQVKSAISDIASSSGIDERFILAVVMQESKGCVRAPTTNYGVTNPGLMQSHDGTGSCNNGAVQDPCPQTEISQMIKDGSTGTSAGDGLEQTMSQCGATDVSKYYKAARIYNSGSIAASGNLEDGIATHCYSSDIANRLTGWVNAQTTCNL